MNKSLTEKFIEKYKAEYDEFSNKEILNDIKTAFIFFNVFFNAGEVNSINSAMETIESLYRTKDSCSWLSHGELTYKPCWRRENVDSLTHYIDIEDALSMYSYILAVHNNCMFYMEYNSVSKVMVAESIKHKPLYFDLIDGIYRVEDGEVVFN